MFFNNCTTIDEAKNLYRKLLLKLHPDTSGYDSHNDFLAMQSAFKSFNPDTGNEDFNKDEFIDLVSCFDGLAGLDVEFCGNWVWVSGDTFPMRDQIKAIEIDGYNRARWAKKKQAWYFSPVDYVRKSRKGSLSMEEIRNMHGSKVFKSRERKAIA